MYERDISKLLQNITNPYIDDSPMLRTRTPNGDLEADLLKIIISTAGKYRKGAFPNEDTIKDTLTKIQFSIANKKPISLSVPFGAYKGWQITESLGLPDWAEVFHLNYIFHYAYDIACRYEYGVDIVYTYQDKIMSHISNADVHINKKYAETFNKLLNRFSSYSEKINFRLLSINDLYDNDEHFYGEFVDLLFENILELGENLYNGESAIIPYKSFIDLMIKGQKQEAFEMIRHSDSSVFAKLQSGYNNYNFAGFSNKTNHSQDCKEKQILRAIISSAMIDAVDSLTLRRKFNKYSNNIQLVFDRRPTLCLRIGSCQTSIKHFWTGTGVLFQGKKGLFPTILSQKEWVDVANGSAIHFAGECEEKTFEAVSITVTNDFVDICNNYSKINLLKQEELL